MKPTVEQERLQDYYCTELIKAGVSPRKAEQAAKSMSSQELMLIGEIWGQWASILSKS